MSRALRSGHVSRFVLVVLALGLVPRPAPLAAQDYTIADILSPAFAYDLVSARDADRIAWLEYERGMRNVYTAEAPGFRARRLTDWMEDDGRDLSSLQISDDGSVLLFVRGHTPNRQGWVANPTSDPDGAEREAWAVRSSGGEPWRVAEAWDPVLSPDGRWIAYTKDGQVHRAPVFPDEVPGLDADGDEVPGLDPDTAGPWFIVFGENDDPVWSPDSRRVAFVSERDDHGYVGVYDVEAHTITYMAPGVDRDDDPAWSPDGRRIAFVRRPGEPFGADEREPWWRRSVEPDTTLPDGLEKAGFRGGHTLEIWVADAATGAGERLWHTWPKDERFTDIRRLDWVGDRLVFESEPGPWEGHHWAITVANPEREPEELTPGDGYVEHVAYSADDRWLYYTANIGDVDRRHLWRVPIDGGEPEQITDGEMLDTYPAVLASGETVAVLQAGPAQVQTAAVVDVDDGDTRTLREPPREFPARRHVEPRNVVITAEDGVRSHAQLFLPPDLEEGDRRPALMFIHGGSRRQMLLGYHYMHFYHMAYAMNQYFANKGYVTLSINYRSGIGYGTEFRDVADYGRRGNSEYRDIIAAGRYLQSRPDVDPDRVGLWGLSYGGILTAQGLARNSDVFEAGVDMAGVHLYGGLEQPDSTLYQSSAIAAIDTWESPVLLLHGDDDRNVDFSQTVGLVQLLRAHDVPYELIVYPDDVHDSLLFHRWIHAFSATDDFFERWLVGGT